MLETRLKLDSNDHQGARYVLLGILQARQLTDAAEALLKKNKGDPGVTFVWGRVFQAWCTFPQIALVVLVQVLETQPHGLEMILMAELPGGAGQVASYRRGSLEEALAEGPLLRRPWLTVPKARTWLSEAHQTFSREAARSRHKES